MCPVQVSKHSGPIFLGFGVMERRGEEGVPALQLMDVIWG